MVTVQQHLQWVAPDVANSREHVVVVLLRGARQLSFSLRCAGHVRSTMLVRWASSRNSRCSAVIPSVERWLAMET